MTFSNFTTEETENLLKTITEAEIFDSLKYLNLSASTEFSSDQSVRYLALLLAKAKNLKLVDITNQIGRTRKIDIQVSRKKVW